MTLRASLLRQLQNPSLGVDRRAELCCEASRELEDKGECKRKTRPVGRVWMIGRSAAPGLAAIVRGSRRRGRGPVHGVRV